MWNELLTNKNLDNFFGKYDNNIDQNALSINSESEDKNCNNDKKIRKILFKIMNTKLERQYERI